MKITLLSLIATCMLTSTAFAQIPQDCDGVRYKEVIFQTNQKIADVVYGQNSTWDGQNLTLKMDIYLPPETDNVTNRPVILWAHGGSFIGGSKDAQEVVQFAEAFAKRGFVCASISYRLGINIGAAAGGGEAAKNELFKAAIRGTQDGKGAVRFFRKSADEGNPYKIDPNRIYFGGSSAGAFIALHLAYLNEEAEFAEMANLSILNELGGLEGNSGNAGFSSKVQGCINLCGALGKADWLDAEDNVPHIGMHGTADAVVPYKKGTAGVSVITVPVEGSYLIDSVAKAKGALTHFYTWYGADHVPYANGDNTAKYRDSTIAFVQENLYPYVCGVTSRFDKVNAQNHFSLYPNPTQQSFSINATSPYTYSCNVYNLQGKLVYSAKELRGNALIPTDTWAPGVYSVQIMSEDKLQTLKQVIN